MSHRHNAITAMRGENPAHIPFIGRMNLWYNYHSSKGTLPQRYHGWSQWDIQRDLGIGILGFGAWVTTFFRKVYRGIEVTHKVENGEEITTYSTPHGTLRTRHVISDLLRGTVDAGRDMEVLFKDHRDYDALQYLVEHTEIVENYDEYGLYVDSLGEDGIALPFTGWAPMHEIMWKLMGVERFYYELQDHPRQIESLHQAMLAQHWKIIELAGDCPATAIEVGGNYSDQLTPPWFFEDYVSPFYRRVRERFSQAGKILVVHGDGDMDKLLALLMESGVQVVEALTPQPSTSIDVRRTRALWDGRVVMWGGIPFNILTPEFTDGEFRDHIEALYRAVAPGDHFVLGFGDNVPPEALFSRIKWVADFNRENGSYPIDI